MPTLFAGEFEVSFSRTAMLLDTNVLCAYFDESEGTIHSDMRTLVDDVLPTEYGVEEYLVPTPVVVEAFNLLNRDRSSGASQALLDWVCDPGSGVVVVPCPRSVLDGCRTLTRSLQIDVVDAIVMQLATLLSTECRLKPPMTVVSRDSRDYPLGRRRPELKFMFFDANVLESY